MGQVLFIDPVATSPYDDSTLRSGAMGGTEATVVRIAQGLARRRAVAVAQRARDVEVTSGGVRWLPWDYKDGLPAIGPLDAIVVLRAHKVLKRIRRRNATVPMFLWMHCFPGKRLADLGECVSAQNCTLLAVSEHHRREMLAFVSRHGPGSARSVRVETVYNPIDDDLVPDGTPWDPDRLLFASSPHKGLDRVLEAFQAVRSAMPSVRLEVANPGYLERELQGDLRGVLPLGKLPHRELVERVRRSLCSFHPQDRFAETFGLVFAEANAVGTPVLTHPIGAAPEILRGDPAQLVDARDHEAIIDRIARFRRGERPVVAGDPRFRLSAVLRRWETLLSAHDVERTVQLTP